VHKLWILALFCSGWRQNVHAVHAQLRLGPWPELPCCQTPCERRWRLDYSLSCYRGQHGVLTYALGVPGLLLIALACPLVTAWWLAYNHDSHEDPLFRAK
jgi:hypothetical protein